MQDTIPQLKAWIKSTLQLSDGMLHINAGLGLFVIFSVALAKRRKGLLIAWVLVFALQSGNEAFDLWHNRYGLRWGNFEEAIKDFIATLFWPTVLLLVWRPLTRRRDADTTS